MEPWKSTSEPGDACDSTSGEGNDLAASAFVGERRPRAVEDRMRPRMKLPPSSDFSSAMLLHIIYTESAIFLSKKAYASWREIQDEFSDYSTSLGPWETDAVTEYLNNDYLDLAPPAATQVAELLRSNSVLRQLTFLV
jgi:hypothetical protein